MTSKEKNTEEFVKLLVKLGTVEVVGVAKMLGVKLVNLDEYLQDQTKFRDAADIIEDCIDKFYNSDRQTRRLLIKEMKKSINK